jgi:hypothetical protein
MLPAPGVSGVRTLRPSDSTFTAAFNGSGRLLIVQPCGFR